LGPTKLNSKLSFQRDLYVSRSTIGAPVMSTASFSFRRMFRGTTTTDVNELDLVVPAAGLELRKVLGEPASTTARSRTPRAR